MCKKTLRHEHLYKHHMGAIKFPTVFFVKLKGKFVSGNTGSFLDTVYTSLCY